MIYKTEVIYRWNQFVARAIVKWVRLKIVYISKPKFVPGMTYGPPLPPWVIPDEYRAKINPSTLPGMTQKENKKILNLVK